MCGISGVFDYSRSGRAIERGHIEAMNRAIAHRGPDDRGCWEDPARGVWLGHQRLSILDLSPKGHQPMTGEDGSVIVFNGEIYNFRELREDFPDRRFHSDSDTEVILSLYERNGRLLTDFLNGMFAFAIWDPKRESLFLARDRIGIKPLYYTTLGGVFAFSSELKALLTLPWVQPELDEHSLYHFLTFNKLSAPNTMFAGIRKFHPGHSMVVGRQGIEAYGPFWDLQYQDFGGQAAEELEGSLFDQLQSAVRYRMIADVPVGAFLSGGVDSSAIVGLMSEVATGPVKTYSVGFKGAPNYDEREHARAISSRFGTEHYEKEVTREEIVEFLPRVVEVYDEPLADATSIPIYFICEMARQMGSKVVLTGDGADELYCGYRGWLRYQRFDAPFRALSQLPAPLLKAVTRIAALGGENSVAHEMLSRAASRQQFFWGGAGGLKESAKRSVLGAAFAGRMQSVDLHEHVAELRRQFESTAPGARRSEIVDWMCFVGLKDIIPNFYMSRADRLGMAHSIELRVPFLDHRHVGFAMSLPAELKSKGGEPKYLLKKALERILPKETLYRRKQGFCVPLDEWMGPTIVNYLEHELARFCADTDYLDEGAVKTLLSSARAGNTSVVHALWNIYFLICWFNRWMR